MCHKHAIWHYVQRVSERAVEKSCDIVLKGEGGELMARRVVRRGGGMKIEKDTKQEKGKEKKKKMKVTLSELP